MERLFQKSFHAVWSAMLSQAVRDVERMNRTTFLSPELLREGINSILQKHEIEVAAFDGEVTAKRREAEREMRDGWGDYIKQKLTWLDVRIPFTGEAETFRVAPSRFTIPSHQVSIDRDFLTLTIPDDDQADRVVQEFKQTVSGTLDTLRAEYTQHKPQLEQTIQQAADRMKLKIQTEDERDSKRSFRVDN